MPKSATFDTALLALVFNGTAITNLAQNGVSPIGTLYVACHSADPTITAGAGTVGTQNASEIAYTSYARVPVVRSAGGFTVTANSVSPVAAITFPAGTGGSGTASFFSIGAASSGATAMYYSGAISPAIVTGAGVTPILTTASTVVET